MFAGRFGLLAETTMESLSFSFGVLSQEESMSQVKEFIGHHDPTHGSYKMFFASSSRASKCSGDWFRTTLSLPASYLKLQAPKKQCPKKSCCMTLGTLKVWPRLPRSSARGPLGAVVMLVAPLVTSVTTSVY